MIACIGDEILSRVPMGMTCLTTHTQIKDTAGFHLEYNLKIEISQIWFDWWIRWLRNSKKRWFQLCKELLCHCWPNYFRKNSSWKLKRNSSWKSQVEISSWKCFWEMEGWELIDDGEETRFQVENSKLNDSRWNNSQVEFKLKVDIKLGLCRN